MKFYLWLSSHTNPSQKTRSLIGKTREKKNYFWAKHIRLHEKQSIFDELAYAIFPFNLPFIFIPRKQLSHFVILFRFSFSFDFSFGRRKSENSRVFAESFNIRYDQRWSWHGRRKFAFTFLVKFVTFVNNKFSALDNQTLIDREDEILLAHESRRDGRRRRK